MKASTEKAIDRFGLVANGSSGVWDFSIDESVKGAPKWFAEIEGPAIYLSFQLVDRDIIDKMIAFLDRRVSAAARSQKTQPGQRGEELTIGNFGRASVSLIGDNEEEERCFLVIGPQGSCCMRFPLVGKDTRMILAALRQVHEDLSE